MKALSACNTKSSNWTGGAFVVYYIHVDVAPLESIQKSSSLFFYSNLRQKALVAAAAAIVDVLAVMQ